MTMEALKVFLLGVVQGLTEFLPVSSSGHLVLLQNAFGMKEPEILLDICLHVGTLAAVCVVFFTNIKGLALSFFRFPGRVKSAGGIAPLFRADTDFRTLVLIGSGSLPTALLGLFFQSRVDFIFGSPRIVGTMLLVTGLLLFLTRKHTGTGRPLESMKIRDALLIGLAQGMAILPGLSRSGATICTALFLGVERKAAAPFSFLLSVPAILGALFLQASSSLTPSPLSVKILLLGSFTAAVVGFFALKLLLRVVNHGRLFAFAPYCWAVGILVWILSG